MTDATDLIRPNGVKLVLALTLLLPILFLVLIITEASISNLAIPVILAIVLSYAVSCGIDHFIKSRTVKIIIASLGALVSIVIGYILVRSTVTVCDPVHIPTQEPTVITPVTTTTETPMVFDPVHAPSACEQACRDAVQNATNMTNLVAQKLNECLQNCYK